MKPSKHNKESGNVLFLILIAVALFAALSYAVTQSTRSGGGSTEREQALLGSSAMTQYPTALRTSVIRMILGGIGVEDLLFNPPSGSFGGETATDQLVFHPDGGGAVYQESAADVMAGSNQGVWIFSGHWEVPEVGTDGTGGNDIIAFLPGVSAAVCSRVNEELGIDGVAEGCTMEGDVPELSTTADDADVNAASSEMITGYTLPTATAADNIIECQAGTSNPFSGQASGCFYAEESLDLYVFYSVLLER